MDKRVNYIEHKGKRMIFLDISNAKEDEIIAATDDYFKEITSNYMDPKSEQKDKNEPFLELIDIRDSQITKKTKDVVNKMHELEHLNPNFKNKLAIVGLSAVQRMLTKVAVNFAQNLNTELQVFKDLDEAKEWLIKNE